MIAEEPMGLGLMFTLAGLAVAALSSVLGIWMERDPRKPPRWAIMLSVLIVLATGVGMVQCFLDSKESEKMEADMARLLATLDKLTSADGTSPALQDMLKSEMNAQARANPSVMKKLAQRVADEGGDPEKVLSSYLSAAELQAMSRKGGLKTAPPTAAAHAVLAAKNEREQATAAAAKATSERDQKEQLAPATTSRGSDAGPGDKAAEESSTPGVQAATANQAATQAVAINAAVAEDKATAGAKETANEAAKDVGQATDSAAGLASKAAADTTSAATSSVQNDAEEKTKKAEKDAKKKGGRAKKKAEKEAKQAVGGLLK
jgi:hypothetical protein